MFLLILTEPNCVWRLYTIRASGLLPGRERCARWQHFLTKQRLHSRWVLGFWGLGYAEN